MVWLLSGNTSLGAKLKLTIPFVLREFSYKTYNDTFRHMNTPFNIRAYLEQAFDISKLRDELSNSGSLFYFLYAYEELAGYIK